VSRERPDHVSLKQGPAAPNRHQRIFRYAHSLIAFSLLAAFLSIHRRCVWSTCERKSWFAVGIRLRASVSSWATGRFFFPARYPWAKLPGSRRRIVYLANLPAAQWDASSVRELNRTMELFVVDACPGIAGIVVPAVTGGLFGARLENRSSSCAAVGGRRRFVSQLCHKPPQRPGTDQPVGIGHALI